MIHNKYIFGKIKSKNTLRYYIYNGERKYNRLRQVTQNEYSLIYVHFAAKKISETVVDDKLQHHTLITFISHRSQVGVNASI